MMMIIVAKIFILQIPAAFFSASAVKEEREIQLISAVSPARRLESTTQRPFCWTTTWLSGLLRTAFSSLRTFHRVKHLGGVSPKKKEKKTLHEGEYTTAVVYIPMYPRIFRNNPLGSLSRVARLTPLHTYRCEGQA